MKFSAFYFFFVFLFQPLGDSIWGKGHFSLSAGFYQWYFFFFINLLYFSLWSLEVLQHKSHMV